MDQTHYRRASSEIINFSVENQTSVPFDGKSLKPGFLADTPNPHMSLLDTVCTRRTARFYRTEPVKKSEFDWLIRHSMYAPTACNEQRWKVIYIDDPELITDLHARGSASFLKNVKQCFLLCYSRRTDNTEWNDHIQSGAAFINTFQLLAHSIGIGSCWIGHLPNKNEMKRLFKIHSSYDPIALVSFGYYRSDVKLLPKKRNLDQVISTNRFTDEKLMLKPYRIILGRKFFRHLYYLLPAFIRVRIRPHVTRFEKKFYYEIYD